MGKTGLKGGKWGEQSLAQMPRQCAKTDITELQTPPSCHRHL